MIMDIIGFTVLALHVIFIFVLVLWFALGKPTSRAEFWRRFCHELLGIRPKNATSSR